MGCTDYISTIVECKGCQTTRAVRHAKGASPVIKLMLRKVKCTGCGALNYQVKE